MKRFFIGFILLISVVQLSYGKPKTAVYAIGFYNLENLFDTCHDSGKDDYQFLPDGSYKWDTVKYIHKIRNMARALAHIGSEVLPMTGCAVIGLSEVENERVLIDLCNEPQMRARDMKYIHIEGEGKRGIDCALIYNPSMFSVVKTELIPFKKEDWMPKDFATRGFLTVEGTMDGERMAFIICHLPSRASDATYREAAAKQAKMVKDSLIASKPKTKVIIMGDMNDDPTDDSMVRSMKATHHRQGVKADEMYNPWYNKLVREGIGTLMYRGKWNLFDQIILSPNLVSNKPFSPRKTLKYWKSSVCNATWLAVKDGSYRGAPRRTTARGVWQNGYSDHFPVVVYLHKKK